MKRYKPFDSDEGIISREQNLFFQEIMEVEVNHATT